jgi:hypothetical protein
MFFKESAQLLQDHPNLSKLITQIDEQLSNFDASGLAKAVDFASFLNVDHNQVAAIFEKLAASKLLTSIGMCQCNECGMATPAADFRAAYASGEELLCPDCGTDLIRQSPKQFTAYRLSERAVHQVVKSRMTPNTKVEDIVLLVHGILTEGAWQEKVASELRLIPGVEAQPIGYGIVELFMFWCPILTRRFALNKVLRKIRHTMRLYPGARVSVIAHSFGTYCVFRILNENADIAFDKVIFCGCIVSDEYPWDFVQPRVAQKIINDCGTRDFWPAAAKSLSWGYGATGTFGFKSPGIFDRFHDFDHGGFFDEEFVRTYWVPYIARGEIIPSPWTTKRPPSPPAVKTLATIPIQWICSLTILIVGYLVYRWWF